MKRKELRKVNKKGISKRQQRAIEMLLDIEKDYTKKEIAAKLGISETALYKWFKKEEFVEELNKQSEEFFKRSKNIVNKALLKKIMKGDVSAMRLYYEKENEFVQKHQFSGNFELVIDGNEINDSED
ncbi:hypothetical protein X275_01270 [Marinitoga sp. 1197]|uniref:phBC6A51 family helix-turn-helix protein n=1 Tax=Marinitoga sp. 1197 TaxID=1428449 RepID=UPI000641538D|nr:phBC6A51 family helix-turn-helix protein [Marinitoga sp. 1197]AJW76901.1 hypothetical protein UF08_12 [Marinitoga camini virus 1]KLO24049.1 hypothetical protein X275_01270 [Marinitoga sp. 1197]